MAAPNVRIAVVSGTFILVGLDSPYGACISVGDCPCRISFWTHMPEDP